MTSKLQVSNDFLAKFANLKRFSTSLKSFFFQMHFTFFFKTTLKSNESQRRSFLKDHLKITCKRSSQNIYATFVLKLNFAFCTPV